jgi:hypothetical protein
LALAGEAVVVKKSAVRTTESLQVIDGSLPLAKVGIDFRGRGTATHSFFFVFFLIFSPLFFRCVSFLLKTENLSVS